MNSPTKEVSPSIDEKLAALLAPYQLVSLAKFGTTLGYSRITLWRYRQKGWLTASVNIDGRLFLTLDDIKEFVRRAKIGDFASPVQKVTSRRRG